MKHVAKLRQRPLSKKNVLIDHLATPEADVAFSAAYFDSFEVLK